MFGIKTFVGGLMLGCVGMYLAMHFHVINTHDGLIVLPRAHRPPMRSVYVDVRKWSLAMWRQHPEVAESALKYGRPDLLGKGALNSILPQQSSLDTPAAQPTDAEKANLAMESLVPIRFSNAKSNSVDPKPGQSFLPVTPPQDNFNWNQSAPQQVQSIPVPKISGEVLPNGFPWDDLDPSKFPKLQKPIPFDELESTATPAATESTTDWVKALLNSVIPQNEQAATTQPSNESVSPPNRSTIDDWPNPNHSAAPPRPSIGTIQQAPVNPLRQPSTRYYPAVRPF